MTEIRTTVAMGALLAALTIPSLSFGIDSELSSLINNIGTDLGNLESGIQRLEREVYNPVAQSRFYTLEKRLVDARVYYDLKNYDKAAILFSEAITNPQFPTHPDRAKIYYQLGYSLFRMQNFRGARAYLEQMLLIPSGKYYQKALSLLIETGLESRNGEGLEAAVQRISAISVRTPATQYAHGKGLFKLGRSAEALNQLALIPRTAPEFPAALYYVGVLQTDQAKYTDALRSYKQIIATAGNAGANKQIIELAHMAVGRLYGQLKKFSQAIDAYQEIDRHSRYFHDALYEMTWAYINQRQIGPALNALQILLLTVKDEQLATRANILRGRLNMLLDRTDVAVETYNEIVERYAPLRDELDKFAKASPNLRAFFRWLLNRHSDAFQVGAVVSERAATWIETDEELEEVVAIFNEMSQERRDVLESRQIVADLELALASGNRVEIFPNLHNAWKRIIIAENNLILLSQKALDSEGRLAKDRMSKHERAKYEVALKKRKLLEKRFADVPKTESEFNQRLDGVNRQFGGLKRQTFLMETSLKEVIRELNAMEKWVGDARYKKRGRKFKKKEEERIRRMVRQEKRQIVQLVKELETVKLQIKQENARVGAGDFVAQNEATLKRKLLAAHLAEEQMLNAALSRLVGEERAAARQLRSQRGRIVGNFNRLGRLLVKLNRAVDVKVVEYKRLVAAEKKVLYGYQKQTRSFDQDSDFVAREIGVPLFKIAHKRISDVVLEADFGLVDVAWKRKTAETNKIRSLQIEKSERLNALNKTIKAILKD